MKMNLELERILEQFKILWKTGLDAHLDAHTYAGQAWVSLHVRLGHAHEEHSEKDVKKKFSAKKNKNSPSRQRRRIRRAAEREAVQNKILFNKDTFEEAFEAIDTAENVVENRLSEVGDRVDSEIVEKSKAEHSNENKNETDPREKEKIRNTEKVELDKPNDKTLSELERSSCNQDKKQVILTKPFNAISQAEFFSVLDGIMEDNMKNLFKPP